jgi:hypothetical protein
MPTLRLETSNPASFGRSSSRKYRVVKVSSPRCETDTGGSFLLVPAMARSSGDGMYRGEYRSAVIRTGMARTFAECRSSISGRRFLPFQRSRLSDELRRCPTISNQYRI